MTLILLYKQWNLVYQNNNMKNTLKTWNDCYFIFIKLKFIKFKNMYQCVLNYTINKGILLGKGGFGSVYLA